MLYDDNNITIDGDTSLTFTEDVTARYLAYGWQVLSVADGNDVAAIREAVQTAKLEINKPTIIRVSSVNR